MSENTTETPVSGNTQNTETAASSFQIKANETPQDFEKRVLAHLNESHGKQDVSKILSRDAVMFGEDSEVEAAPPKETVARDVSKQATPQTSTEESDDFVKLFGSDGTSQSEDMAIAPLPSKLTLDELSQKYNLSPEDLLERFYVKTKVNDNEAEVPLKEMVKNFQLEKHIHNKSEKIAQKEKEIEALQSQYSQHYNELLSKLNVANNLAERATKDLENRYEKVNWERLKEEDREQYNTLKIEYQEEKMRLNNYLSEVSNAFQRENYELAQRQQQQQQLLLEQQERYRQEQKNLLLKAMPQLRDDKARETFKKEVDVYLKGQGYQENELGNNALFYDHRVYPIVMKAMLYDRMKSGDLKQKQVHQKPKAFTPVARKDAEEVATESMRELGKRAMRGDEKAAIAYLTNLK